MIKINDYSINMKNVSFYKVTEKKTSSYIEFVFNKNKTGEQEFSKLLNFLKKIEEKEKINIKNCIKISIKMKELKK